MEYLVGFIIAVFIALTGVGAGTITVPILVLFMKVPAATAVGIGLMFATVVKLILVPSQIARRNVVWRTLGFMLLGGAPGVLVGSLLLQHLVTKGATNTLNAILGAILVSTSGFQIYSFFRIKAGDSTRRDRTPLLAWLMFPVGAEVGFSSAGAGALGSVALLSLTPINPAQVVGTDILFGFVVSLIGSGAHWFSHASDPGLLIKLIIGGVVGAIVGTLVSTRVPRRQLRFVLLCWLLVLGVQFLFNSYQVWAAAGR